MNNFSKAAVTLLTVAFGATAAMAQGTATFSYSTPGDNIVSWGTAKAETYNIAIRVVEPAMVGKKITGLRVPCAETENISGIQGFITTELARDSQTKGNKADVCTKDGSVDNGYYVVKFDEPYTLTADGVYCGYTFTVDKIDAASRMPVKGTAGNAEDGLWVMSSRTYMTWKSRTAQAGMVSALEVQFEGDFASVSLGVDVETSVPLMSGESFTMPLIITNHGTEAIKDFDYTVEIDGKTYSNKKTFDQPLTLTYGAQYTTTVPVVLPTVAGSNKVTVTIDKVNGQENKDEARKATVDLQLLSFVPKKRPLVEEFTGTWCGNCTRGLASLEYMNNNHKDDFVCLSYHGGSDDPLITVSQMRYPVAVSGFPTSWIDRELNIDPYYGTSGGKYYGFENDWKTFLNKFTPADLEVTVDYDENDPMTVVIDVTTTFVRNDGGNYRLLFYLVGNGLTDPSWNQANYMSGAGVKNYEIPEAHKFCESGKYYYGYVYDDVVLAAGNTSGESGTLENFAVNTPMKDTYRFDLGSCNTTATLSYASTNPALKCKETGKLYGVVAVVDTKTQKVINSIKCQVGHTVAVDEVASDNVSIKSVKYYDMSGVAVERPATGIYVKVTEYSDGRRVSKKEYVK